MLDPALSVPLMTPFSNSAITALLKTVTHFPALNIPTNFFITPITQLTVYVARI